MSKALDEHFKHFVEVHNNMPNDEVQQANLELAFNAGAAAMAEIFASGQGLKVVHERYQPIEAPKCSICGVGLADHASQTHVFYSGGVAR